MSLSKKAVNMQDKLWREYLYLRCVHGILLIMMIEYRNATRVSASCIHQCLPALRHHDGESLKKEQL